MLCFVFAALVAILDQFFKRWILRTLDLFEQGPEIIPGVLGLTHIENPGAFAGMLAGQRWLLTGIAFAAAIVLIMILLRYNEGFWGTLGLAAVLGGTAGNLIDRLLYGHVIDMFKTLFIDFWIFNIADIFITLGFLTFCIHFISISIKSGKEAAGAVSEDYSYTDEEDYDYPDEPGDQAHDAHLDANDAPSPYGDAAHAAANDSDSSAPKSHVYFGQEPQPQDAYEPIEAPQADFEQTPDAGFEQAANASFEQATPGFDPQDISLALDALETLESELDGIGDYDVDELLREYGFDDEQQEETQAGSGGA